MHPFRSAVGAGDVEAMLDLLSEDVVGQASIRSRQVEGCDVIRVDEDGSITELTVMIR